MTFGNLRLHLSPSHAVFSMRYRMACKLPSLAAEVRYVFRNYHDEATSMRGESTLKTVLILDDDLRFGFWLGHLLDAATVYSALPARSVPDATLLVRQLNLKVDVLVINLALTG